MNKMLEQKAPAWEPNGRGKSQGGTETNSTTEHFRSM
jgi:hypothetical protein